MVLYKNSYNSVRRKSFRGGNRNFYSGNSTEIKMVDNDIQFTLPIANPPVGVNPNASITLLNGIFTGNGSFNRVGVVVTPIAISLRGSVAPNTNNNAPGPYVRVALVYDGCPVNAIIPPATVPSQVIPPYESIYQGIKNNGNTYTSGSVQMNPSFVERFQILKDDQIQLGYVSQQTVVTPLGNFQFTFSTSPAQTEYNMYNKKAQRMGNVQYLQNASQQAPTNVVTTGAYYLVVFSSTPISASFSVRFFYTDK